MFTSDWVTHHYSWPGLLSWLFTLYITCSDSTKCVLRTHHHSGACCNSSGSKTPQLSQQAVADQYGKGLAAAADLQRTAVKLDTLKTRRAAIRELANWLQSKQAACNRTDILVYFTQHWLPSHAQCKTADGELIAAPGSLSSTKSHNFQRI